MTNDLTIPDFLLVKNRKPLSPELAARLAQWKDHAAEQRNERWRAMEAIRAAERRAKTEARVDALRASKGLPPLYGRGE